MLALRSEPGGRPVFGVRCPVFLPAHHPHPCPCPSRGSGKSGETQNSEAKRKKRLADATENGDNLRRWRWFAGSVAVLVVVSVAAGSGGGGDSVVMFGGSVVVRWRCSPPTRFSNFSGRGCGVASVEKDAKGYRVRFIDAEQNRRGIRLSGLNKAAVQKIACRIDELVSAQLAGIAVSRETSDWLSRIGRDLSDKLAAAGLIQNRASRKLGGFLGEYVEGRPDTKESTRKKFASAVGHLVGFFGENRDLRTISKGDADGFRAFLYRQGHAENTVRRYCGLAKQFFRAAFRRKLVDENPFSDQVAAVRGNAAKFYFVTREDSEKILAACPDVQWRMIFALARFGGLRCPSEVVSLQWEDISWKAKRITVRSPKTEHHEGKAERIIPLFPELAELLSEGFEQASEAIDEAGGAAGRRTVSGPVITRYRCSTQNLRTTFQKILKRAGLKPWPKLMQNLRSTRETELAEQFPLHAVTAWLGNSHLVAAKHYLQLRDEHFDRAAGGGSNSENPDLVGLQVGHKTSEVGRIEEKSKKSEVEKTGVFPANSRLFASLPKMGMGPTGLEPVTFRM